MSVSLRLGSVFGLCGLAVGLAATEAGAAGFQLREQSAAGLGNSFAGSAATAEDASTIYYNPAGMTLLKGTQTYGTSTLVMPQTKFKGTGFPGGVGSGDAIADALTGSTFAFWDYSQDVKLGIGVTTPFGMRTGYTNGWVGGPYALQSSLTTVNINPSIAYRVNSNLSIGAGVQIAYTQAVLNQQIAWGGPVATPFAEVKGDDIGFGFNVGAMWEFSPTTRVGVAYRSEIKNSLDGTLKFETANHLAFLSVPAKAGFNTPATASIGFVHDLTPTITLKAGVDWTQWSTFKSLIVVSKVNGAVLAATPENWKDSWFFSLGADYKIAKGHTLHFGTAYDQSPVKDAFRTARVPDASRYWLSTGYSYDVTKDIRFDLSYAHLFVDKAKINETGLAFPLVGTYKGSVDIVSTGLVYKF